MAFTVVPDKATGDTVTEANWDTHLRDNINLLGKVAASLCQGRLTLASATPVPTADQTAKSTLYYTPYLGEHVGIYDGTNWIPWEFAEISLNLDTAKGGAALDASLPHDIFLYSAAGTLTLSATAWTNPTTRATSLVYQDGVLVKNGATGYRYLGTICTTAVAGDVEDSDDFRGLWNYYNRVPRRLKSGAGANHAYATAVWRSYNADAALRVEFVIGVLEDAVQVNAYGGFIPSVNNHAVSCCVDATNASDSDLFYVNMTSGEQTHGGRKYLAIGYHFVQLVEGALGGVNGTYDGAWIGGVING